MDAAIIRQGELVNRGIMAYETTEEVGSVEHLLVDVKAARVMGLVCKAPGLVGRRQSLAWAQLVKIGGDRILIKTEISENLDSHLSAAQDITDLEVWTDGGDLIGRVVDLCFDQSSGQVEQYLFARRPQEDQLTEEASARNSDELVDGVSDEEVVAALYGEEECSSTPISAKTTVFTILPDAIISAGRKRVMITEEDAEAAKPYGKPLNLSPVKSEFSGLRAERLAEQLPLPADFSTDFGELLQKGQSLAGEVSAKVRERARQFTDEQFADREFGEAGTLPEITEQLQERTEQVRQQMQERLSKARERAKNQIERSGLEEKIDETLGKTSFGRSLGKQLNKFRRPQPPTEPIDVESFEVWEDD